MTSEKEFKRENGDTIKVTASLFVYGSLPNWSTCVWIKQKGKRKYKYIDSYSQYVSVDEITQVKTLLLDKIKETITNISL